MEILKTEYELKGHKVDPAGRVIDLTLEGSQVNDQALGYVSKLKMLQGLSIKGSSVTDAGLISLHGLKRLQMFNVMAPNVTDSGFASLQNIPSLRLIWVNQTEKLTERGFDFLKEAIPGVHIYVMNRPQRKQ